MEELRDRVAVVTGAASGIGRALARALAGEGMRLALLDVEDEALAAAAAEFGPDALAVPVDVADAGAMASAADRVFERFGRAHLLCNNAGVAGGKPGPLWEATPEHWAWVLGVNLLGVAHGLRAFVPRMLAGGEEGHVLNTASLAGLLAFPGGGAYGASKHAVVALSEQLALELREATAGRVGVSVLCPAWVKTAILRAGRNRPAHLRAPDDDLPAAALFELSRTMAETGLEPEAVAAQAVDAIRRGRFLVLPDEWSPAVAARARRLATGAPPVVPAPEAP